MTTLHKISVRQIRAIHALVRAKNIDDMTYRSMLAQYGATHSTDLSRNDAADLIQRIRGHSQENRTVRPTGRISDHLTRAQADEIARLEAKLGWQDNPHRLYGLIRRVLKKNAAPCMLMQFEASRLIVVLRKIAKEK